jgi:type IV pilus assembly protein PilY1
MTLSRIKKYLPLVIAAAYPLLAAGEDIDLFQGGTEITGNRPNVLFIVDNSANWARNDQGWPGGVKQGEAELSALVKVVGQQTSNIRMGLLMFTNGQNTNGGGYVRFGLREMNKALAMDSSGNPITDSVTNATKLQTILRGIRPNFNSATEKVSAAQSNYSNVLYEAYRYFGGKAMYASPVDGKRDYLWNGAYNVSPYTAGNVYENALAGQSATQYNSPLSTEVPCSKNYIIFIGNGFPSRDTDPSAYGDTRVNTYFNETQIFSSSKTNYADEWARFLKDYGVQGPCTGTGDSMVCADGTINTYTIDVYKNKQDLDQTQLLKSMASVGGGKYYAAKSEDEIVNAINSILNEVQAVDSVFTSASLPVSVNTQGTYLNQIYMGVFRPDGEGRPRWVGNLKQYRFGMTTDAKGEDQIYLADSTEDEDGNPTPAINSVTGFIKPDAVSYWSYQNTTNPFWTFNPRGEGGQYDAPDGDLVEKGGAAQRLRELGPDARKVYTCSPSEGCASPTLETFSTSNSSLIAQIGDTGVDVALSRKGPTVTATLNSDIGLTAPNDVVSISNASIAAYNGTWTTTSTEANSLTFTFTIPETPATPASGAGITVASGATITKSLPAGSLTYNNDPASLRYGQAVVSLSSHGFIQDQSITINGADQTAYNGTYRINLIDANTFSYVPTLATAETPEPIHAEGSHTAPVGNVDCGTGGSYGLVALYRETGDYSSTVVAITSKDSDNKCTVGKSASISNVTAKSGYNVSFEIMGLDASCPTLYSETYTSKRTFCFTIPVDSVTVIPASPATGAITASGIPTRNVTSITRSDGDAQNKATVTVKTKQAHEFSAASQVKIEGADQVEYNGTKTTTDNSLAFPDASTITFTLTTGPITPPSGAKASRGYQMSSGLIDWVRGKDNKEDENRNTDLTDVRASIHGDVLHSRPLVVNYGDTTGLVAFYGANDGTLRAVKAGNAQTDGGELWSYVSSEHYGTLGRLYNNLPLIKYPNTPEGMVPTPTKRNYFFDGNLGVYQSANLATTHIFAAMRRGGRALYALDVSTPSSPSFLWKRTNRNIGFSELGLTFSEPKVAVIKKDGALVCDTADANTYQVVLVFGAGYDAAEEDKPAGEARTPQMGRGVFVLDAATGALVKFLSPTNTGTKYSFAADVTFLDIDSDTCIDRIYAADTGGNIHRYDLPNTLTTVWNAYHVAQLGDIEGDGGSNDRKFLYPVDAVIGYEGDSQVVYLMGGTGDRETPRDILVKNHFFMVKDTIPVSDGGLPSGYPRRLTDLTQVTLFDSNSTLVINPYDPNFKGWYLPYSASGEKSVNAPLTVAGVTYFGTNTPKAASGQCAPNLGEARGYALNFLNGTSAAGDRDGDGTIDESDLYANFVGGGLPPSPVTGVVKIGSEYKRFVIGSGGTGVQASAIQGYQVQANPSSNRTRVYWYFKKDE